MGIDDGFPAMAVRHGDTEHDHIHLIFSRVSVDGRVHNQANIGLRCASIERVIEREFNLKLFKLPPSVSPVPVTKNEIEKALREKQQPPRMQLHSAIAEAIKDKPTTRQFVERLQLAGISIKPNLASTGKMSGFSFSLDGVSFGASKIHKDFGWASLQKELNYDEARDSSFLARLNNQEGARGIDLTATSSRIAELVGNSAPANLAVAKQGASAGTTPTAQTSAAIQATASTAPAAAPGASSTTQDGVAKIRRPRLDPVNPSQLNKKEQDHGTTDNSPSGHPSVAAVKNFGKFKRRAGARGLRTLSKITLAPHLECGELLLRSDGRDNMAGRNAEDSRNSGVRLPSTASRTRIAPPNLSAPAWQRSASLLQAYRDAAKKDRAIQLTDLDREAIEAGHVPEDVINAHAILADVPHAEAALKVSGAAPTTEVLKHVETEYKQAAQRSAARLAHNLDHDAPKPPAPI